MKLIVNDSESYGEFSVNSFEKRLKKEDYYILVKTNNIDYKTLINVGRAYQRLYNRIKGYSVNTATQLLETIPYMEDFREEFYKENGNVVMVLGIQDDKRNEGLSVRHTLEDILIKE